MNHIHSPSHTALRVIAWAALLTCQPLAWAGSAAGEFELPGVTVTSSATPSGTGAVPRNLPANSAGFSAKEISEQVNVINTDDIVKYSPDTMTRKRYIGDRNGIVETRTADVTSSARSLVYFDGVLLSNLLGNNYNFPPRWGMVSPEAIKRVDFFFGPYSSAFSGNSIGTTVLMTSRSPTQFEASGKVQTFSENFDQYGHAATNTGGSASASVGNKAGAMTWLLSFNHLESTGHPMSYVALDSSSLSTIGGSTAAKGATIDGARSGITQDTDLNGAQRVIVGATSWEKTQQDTLNAKLTFDLTPTLKAQYVLGSWTNHSHNYVDSYLVTSSGQHITSGTALNGLDYYVNDGSTNYKIKANAFSENTWSQQHWLNALTLKSNTRSGFDWEAVLSSYRMEDTQHTSQPDGKCGTGTLVATGSNAGACGSASQANAYFGTQVNNPQGDGWRTFDWRGAWKPAALPGHDTAFGYHWDQYDIDTQTWFTSAAATGSSWESAASSGALSAASKGSTHTDALYGQDAWRFSPDWKLTTGLRAERWQAFDGQNTQIVTVKTSSTRTNTLSTADYADRQLSRLSPKLALDYIVSDDWLVRGAVGQAWRFPTVSELFQPISTSTSLTVNNPDLKPENARSMELTAERGLDAGLLRMSVFVEYVQDAIYKQRATVDGVSTTAFTNVDAVRTRGVTLAYQQANTWLSGLDVSGSATYADPRVIKDTVAQQANPSVNYAGKVYPGVPKWRATGVMTYHPSDKWALTLAARYSGHQAYTLENTESTTDLYGANSSFFVVDVRASWQVREGLRLALGVDNLNNEAYYAYHPMPQRTIHAELKASF